MGLCICYDVRFPELSRQMVDAGAAVILVPAAFNRTTGPPHWELLFRARAADNQAFYVGTSPALDMRSCYHAWGHSIVTGPWGNVQGQLGDQPGMQMTELNLDEVPAGSGRGAAAASAPQAGGLPDATQKFETADCHKRPASWPGVAFCDKSKICNRDIQFG